MSKCGYCGVEILDESDVCPLCRGILSDDGHSDTRRQGTYPDVYTRTRRFQIILRVMFAGWLVLTVVCGYINWRFSHFYVWSFAVSVTLLYLLFILRIMTDHESGYLKRIFLAVFGGAVLTVVIDAVFGFQRWSVNYVLPGTLFLINLILLILIFVNRRGWSGYMIHQILSIVIGLVPLLLIRVGIVTEPELSRIAFLSSVLVFLGTLIIGGRTAVNELKRRFHI